VGQRLLEKLGMGKAMVQSFFQGVDVSRFHKRYRFSVVGYGLVRFPALSSHCELHVQERENR
jgi:hypothetical protein